MSENAVGDVQTQNSEAPPIVLIGGFPADFPVAQKLLEAGIDGPALLAAVTDEELLAISGIGAATVAKIREAAAALPDTIGAVPPVVDAPSDAPPADGDGADDTPPADGDGAEGEPFDDTPSEAVGSVEVVAAPSEPVPSDPRERLAFESYNLFRADREADFPHAWSELSDLERAGFINAAAAIEADGPAPRTTFEHAVWAVLNPIN